MPILTAQQRKVLEDACTKGRRAAEQAVRAGLTSLAVSEERPPAHLDEKDRKLRRGLRTKARQLGDVDNDLDSLVAECAFEQWHRLLFARFLAENNLLIHPEYRAPVTLDDCSELAESLGEPDGWSVAGRFAADILPGIFRLDDPCVRMRLAPEGRLVLESIVGGLPSDVFACDDALGWVYQSWQKDRKDEVNASERKIGGADLGPVTQLFTENYMVRFLLENSLGAWWAARHPDSAIIKDYDFLRRDEDGQPSAGAFAEWPNSVAEVTVMDPCCGSGHFLVEAFSMLWRMRVEEEGVTPVEAQDACLRDNLFGLELDARCVQIAMFAVAIQAWKAGGGWRELPVPNIACSGIPVKGSLDDWKALAGDDTALQSALARLHALFRDADTLGSLIDPRRAVEYGDATNGQLALDDTDWTQIAPLLDSAGAREGLDPATAVLGGDAVSLARAAGYLSRRYTLVVTNVPYLTRRRQSESLRRFSEEKFKSGKDDLATTFLLRCWELADHGGVFQLVLPQAWTNLKSYKGLRERLFSASSANFIVKLGTGAFRAISGEVVNVVLASFVASMPTTDHVALVADLEGVTPLALGLIKEPLVEMQQRALKTNPDSTVTYKEFANLPLLSKYSDGLVGMMTGDSPRFIRYFWEIESLGDIWAYQQSTVGETGHYGGREHVMLWESGQGIYRDYVAETGGKLGGAPFRGSAAWGRRGVSISQMAPFRASIYTGELFDSNAAVLLPHQPDLLGPIWHFCVSGELERQLRSFNSSMKVEASTLVKVPIDIDRWRAVAERAELPEPSSDDPTQWLFEGRPEVSTTPLHVAVARLLGYRWPEQPGTDDLDGFADGDGIVCLPSVAGEPSAADRLQQVLAASLDNAWSPAKQTELLELTGSKKRNLGDWLRDDFFKQHCALFGHRPFVWHIWDGKREGFSALVHYHRLDRKTLEKLTYTYLGDWIERQRGELRDDVAGAQDRLAAATKLRNALELILEGEPPHDIYARWKPLAEQAIGWDPDVNDGVRVNVRPFVEAGVLRSSFNVHWRKDRGTNTDDSERLNDRHFTISEKRNARDGTQ